MAKIDQIIVSPSPGFDTGQTAASKLNEAMKSVETGAGMSGNGNVGSPLVADVSRQRSSLAVDGGNNINLDWNGKNELISDNTVAVTANATITYLNTTNAEYSDFAVNISNLATLTFPSGTISPDTNFSTLVWTPPGNGIFSISLTKKGSTYIALFTPTAAV